MTEASQISDLTVTYQPNITINGNYTILLFTPGCMQDGTCNSRGGVDVTISGTSNDDTTSLTLYETNLYDKYDIIYVGDLEKISDGFRPNITLTPSKNQAVPFTFVADRIQVTLNSIAQSVSISSIFEYDPKNFTSTSQTKSTLSVGNTTINSAGPLLGKKAVVNSLFSTGNNLFVGGRFNSTQFGNSIFKIDSLGAHNMSGNGLEGYVNGIESYVDNNELLVYGNFQGSVNGTKNLARYRVSDDEWLPVAHGTNGEVKSVTAFSLNSTTTYGFAGNFTGVYSNSSELITSSSGFNIYIPSEDSWFSQSSFRSIFLQARLTTSATFNNTNFYTGFVRMFQSSSSGASFVNPDFSLSPIPFTFVSNQNSTNSTTENSDVLKKRNIVLNSGSNTINAGTFANSTFSVLGGHFQAQANDLVYNNLIMLNNDVVQGLPNNTIDETSTFYRLYVRDNILYAGGTITGNANNNDISGLLFYDLSTNDYTPIQPPGVTGAQQIVTSIQVRPNTNQLIVAGSFEQAGGLSCNSFCIYDLSANRWFSPTPGLSGLVSSMEFVKPNVVLFAGDLTFNNSQVTFGQYDFDDSSFSTFGDLSTGLPGPVNSFVLNGNSNENELELNSVFASGTDSSTGSAYIAHWNGSSWSRVDQTLEQGSVVTQLSVLDLEKEHASNDRLPNNQVLLVSGNLALRDFGNASSVFYDGESWQPAFITTKGDGSSGMVNSFFSQSTRSYRTFTGKKYMPRGYVVLIALAIAVGLTFLLVALGLLIAYIRRRRQGYKPAPNRVSEAEMAETIPPATLFEEMSNVRPRNARTNPPTP